MALATIEELIEALEDALGYEETGSLAQAKTVITVTNKLLARRPTSMSQDASSVSYDQAQLRQLQDDARRYVKAVDSGRIRFLGPNQGFGRR